MFLVIVGTYGDIAATPFIPIKKYDQKRPAGKPNHGGGVKKLFDSIHFFSCSTLYNGRAL